MLFYPVKDGVWTGEPPITPAKGQNMAGFRRAATAPAGDPGKQYRFVGGSTVWLEEDAGTPAPTLPDPSPLPIVTHYQFATEYLTVDQNDAWLALVEAARDAVAAGTASADQKAQLRAYRHFEMAGAVDFNTPASQSAFMALYVWGALGPVWDQVSEITSAEQAAIDHAARLSQGRKVAGGG